MIKVDNLNFKYPKNKEDTLKNLNFEIAKGEIFGFLGPSGAGKSTTQKILTGLLKKYSGSTVVMGKEIHIWGKDYYENIGVSFELPNLYQKLTAMENLELIASLYQNETENPMELLKIVGLDKDAKTKVSKFSKGMKMRLNFVRALINKPDILFLDEPTSGLDPVNAKNVKDIIINKKNEGKTVFLTTHNMNIADELCDRVGFIVDGEIKLIDSPDELKVKNGKKIVRVEYYLGNKTEKLEFDLNNLGFDKKFNELLQTKKIKTIHTQEASLEEIFIKTTGRRLI